MKNALFTSETGQSYLDDEADESASDLILLHEKPDEWVTKLISKAKIVSPSKHQRDLIDALIDQSVENAQKRGFDDPGLFLAAAFDLLVAVEYYSKLTNTGWLYCPADAQLLIYHYTNTCPRCVLSNQFYFHHSGKPESGIIGGITRRLLCLFLACLFEKNGRDLKVYTAPEPVDILIYDETENVVLLAEAKAAPLTILPLIHPTEPQTRSGSNGEIEPRPHEDTDNPGIMSSRLQLLLPQLIGNSWTHEALSLEARNDTDPSVWAYEQVKRLFAEDDQLFDRYFNFWEKAFSSYNKAERIKGEPLEAAYWLTNACGVPARKLRPLEWPHRKSGKGYESVSDGKSSVGMDRTDDIKKAIYQVLKIATEAKPRSHYKIKTALLSNIHAVNHYGEFLSSLQDVVWATTNIQAVKKAKDLPGDQDIYNLFDGIISFTRNHSRDEWVNRNFSF